MGVSSDRPDASDARRSSGGAARSTASIDLLVAGGLALVAGLAAVGLPDGSTLRMVVVLPILLLVPGYLLLQALIVPARSPATRGRHALLSLGVSPAVLGLLALATAIVPGGFTPGVILVVVTVGCLALAGLGYRRRRAKARVLAGEDEEDVTQTA